MKRILVFSPLYPPCVGGLMSHAQEWNENMARAGYSITVLTPLTKNGGAEQEKEDPNITILRFPAWEVIPNYHIPNFLHGKCFSQFRKAIGKKPDLIVSRTRFFLISAIAAFTALSKRVPHLHIEHGSDFVHLSNPLFNLFAKMYDYTVGRFVLKKAQRIVANSKATATFVKKISNREATVIYRGVQESLIASVEPNLRITEKYSPKVILNYTGRLIDGKGVSDLISALENTIKEVSVHLIIVGDGPQKTELEDLVKEKKLFPHVSFLGEKRLKEAIAIMKASHIFINPSYTEGIPTAVIEAALCNTSIIATDVGGTKEIVTHQDSAMLVKPGNVLEIEKSLITLSKSDAIRAKFCASAYNHVHNKFSWKTSIQKYDKLVKSMI